VSKGWEAERVADLVDRGAVVVVAGRQRLDALEVLGSEPGFAGTLGAAERVVGVAGGRLVALFGGTAKRLGVRCWAGYDRPSF
jgi:hypothetical protein